MQTMAPYPVTPQAPATPRRASPSPRPRAAIVPPATRSGHAAEPPLLPLSAPASQESFVSAHSQGSSVPPPLQSSSSTLSQLTSDTDPDAVEPAGAAPKAGRAAPDIGSERTPGDPAYGFGGGGGGDDVLASPASIASPNFVNGAKRTASGHVKNASSLSAATPMTVPFASGRARADSLSSAGTRAGEMAASLKARLGYAMAKVQNGWELKSIAEVEQLAAHKAPAARHSMSHVDSHQRTLSAGLSNGTARLSMTDEAASPGALDGTTSPPPAKRRSGTLSSMMASPPAPAPPPAWWGAAPLPHLQPPADIRPAVDALPYYAPPSSQSNSHPPGTAMSPPQTPVNGRARRPPPAMRTDTQTAEAERDALQALFQLGSPRTSQFPRSAPAASQASSSQASPLRTELATPRAAMLARSDSEGSSRADSTGDSWRDT